MSRRYEDEDDLVSFFNGAVPRTDIKWGNLALGAAIGSMLGREINNLARDMLAPRSTYNYYTGRYEDED